MRTQPTPAGRRESGPWTVASWLALVGASAVALVVACAWLWVQLLLGSVSLGPD